jgi:hypothetical protein
MQTIASCELIEDVDDLDLVVFGALCRASFGFKVFAIAGPASSMVAMVHLIHDFALAQSDRYSLHNVVASNTYCLNKQISTKH